MATDPRAYRAQASAGNNLLTNIVDRGTAAEQELYGGQGPSTMQAPSGMEIVDGVTSDIYNSYGQLENYAHSMWDNYRINVTRPDKTNPEAIKANQLYMKMLAKLQYASDVLKQSNVALTRDQTAQTEGKGVIAMETGQDIYGRRAAGKRFINTELDPLASQSNMYEAKTFDTQGATDRANTRIQGTREEIQKFYDDAGLSKQGAVKAAQVQDASYDPPQFAPRADGDKDPNQDLYPVFDRLKNIRTGLMRGDESSKAYLLGTGGIISVRPVRTADKSGVWLKYKKNGEEINEYVSFKSSDSTYGGLDHLNEILSSAAPSRFRINTNDLIPYFQKDILGSDEEFEGTNAGIELETKRNVISKLATNTDSRYKNEAGEEVVITGEQKTKMTKELTRLAKAGKLEMSNGAKIVDIAWVKDGWFGDRFLEIDTNQNKEGEPMVLDPNSPEDMDIIREILEFNSEYFTTPSKTTYKREEKIGEAKVGGKTVVDPALTTPFDINKFIDRKKAGN